MTLVEEEVLVEASLAETWQAYFDPRRWADWVDSWGSAVSSDGYPDEGGTLVWRTIAAGRGEVAERVTAHQPRRLHAIEFSDPTLTGRMEVRFGVEGEGTRVRISFEYALVERGPMARFASVFFVRGQIRGTIRRSLDAFALVARDEARSSATAG